MGSGDIRVLAGPFEGMKYFNEVFYFSAAPRWLGTYQMSFAPLSRKSSTAVSNDH